MGKQENYGICRICGKEGELTFEHIPPKQVFNNKRARVLNGEELIKKANGEKVKWEDKQKGMGGYTLCAECNNNTGAWYANDYVKIAKSVAYSLEQYDLKHCEWIDIMGKGKMLSFLKQIIAMFCSTMRIEDVQKLGFDKLLLDKESNCVDKSLFDLRMYISHKSNKSFHTGVMVMFRADNEPDKRILKVAELAAYPFGFILNLTPKNQLNYGVSLMDLFECEYGKMYENVHIRLQCLEKENIENPFPLAYKPLINIQD